jgi:predicted nucleic acid-binding Zn ribbon protein
MIVDPITQPPIQFQMPVPPIQTPLPQKLCKYCNNAVTESDFYCPKCGKKIKEKPASLSPLSLIWLLILSVLLPPLGIGVTIRYMKDSDERARTIGWISLLITIVSIVVMVVLSFSVFKNLNDQINGQLNGFSQM